MDKNRRTGLRSIIAAAVRHDIPNLAPTAAVWLVNSVIARVFHNTIEGRPTSVAFTEVGEAWIRADIVMPPGLNARRSFIHTDGAGMLTVLSPERVDGYLRQDPDRIVTTGISTDGMTGRTSSETTLSTFFSIPHTYDSELGPAKKLKDSIKTAKWTIPQPSDGIRFWRSGPLKFYWHPDGAVSVSQWDRWLAVSFQSPEAAASWADDYIAAELAYRTLNADKPEGVEREPLGVMPAAMRLLIGEVAGDAYDSSDGLHVHRSEDGLHIFKKTPLPASTERATRAADIVTLPVKR